MPLDIVLADGQDPINHLAGDELPAVGITTDGNFDLLVDEGVLLDKPLVDGCREEMTGPAQVSADRVVRQPPAQHGRAELDGVAAGDLTQRSAFPRVPDQLFAALSQVDDRSWLGIRPPPGLFKEPLATVNNHEAWSEEVGNLLKEVLEVENTLSWGYDPRRSQYVFPLHNLRYEPQQTGVEAKREKAREPDVAFRPQDRTTTEHSTFSETGTLAMEIEHHDLFEIENALKLVRLFLREKDETIAKAWPKQRLKDFIVSRLKAARYDETFLSRENLRLLQQGFGPLFRELDKEHPRISQIAKDIVPVDLTAAPRQSFSESMLKEHGFLWIAKEDPSPYSGQELHLWEQYQRYRRQVVEFGDEAGESARAIASRIKEVDSAKFKLPWNVLYASHEPERKFSELLFAHADLFDAFAKMPNVGGYAVPYSYKPAKAAKTHVANENFNPDFFIRVSGTHDILVVEVKEDEDDSNRNRAKCRDGLEHFETLNERLKEAGELWHYDFYFLSPEDYASFLEQVHNKNHRGWRSGLMQELSG